MLASPQPHPFFLPPQLMAKPTEWTLTSTIPVQPDPADDFLEEGEDGGQEANIDMTVTFEATIEKRGKGIT